MDVPVPLEHQSKCTDPRVLFEEVELQIHDKLEEEIKTLNVVPAGS